jgi:O-antigen/teichoic acid export membrane protein
MMTFSLPLIPNALATWVLALSDRYIILHYCGTNEVGLYGIAARFAAAVSLVANGIYMAYTTYYRFGMFTSYEILAILQMSQNTCQANYVF